MSKKSDHMYKVWKQRMEDNPATDTPYWLHSPLNRHRMHFMATLYNGTYLGNNGIIGIDLYCEQDDEGTTYYAVFGNTPCDVIEISKDEKEVSKVITNFGKVISFFKTLALDKPEGDKSDNTTEPKPKSESVRTNSKAKSANTTSKPKANG